MRNQMKAAALIAVSLVLAGGARAWADDEEKLAKAPAAVQAVVKTTLGEKGKLEGCEVAKEDGKTVYDVDLSIGGSGYAMLIAESGEVIQREVEVAQSMVPPAVLEAAMKAQPTGKPAEISIITKGAQMYYEVEMKVGKDEHDINITADGKVTSDTVAKAEAPDAGEKPEKKGDEKKDDKD